MNKRYKHEDNVIKGPARRVNIHTFKLKEFLPTPDRDDEKELVEIWPISRPIIHDHEADGRDQ